MSRFRSRLCACGSVMQYDLMKPLCLGLAIKDLGQ